MTRAEMMKELDRIIDVGIVNAHHDKDVLKEIRKYIAGPVYVVTAGSYSDYHIECVSLDREKAENYAKLLRESNEIDEYLPIEQMNEETITDHQCYIDVKWDPETNEIKQIESTYYGAHCNFFSGVFTFCVLFCSRVGEDLVEHGVDSELAKKVAQDKFAAWKAEDMEKNPERYRKYQSFFTV